ncbi:MAG: REP element-mobilizing transposase RayT [Pirellulaceae bacterium]|jgi:REP element-mobilizing transposase RayT
MTRDGRKETVDPLVVAQYHCVSRVVRSGYLLGRDPLSGKNYDHRKDWIEELTRELAQFFGIDIIAMAILINHIHHQLRSRPDIVKTWSDKEVARRWLMICPGSRKKRRKRRKIKKGEQDQDDGLPIQSEIQALARNEKKIKRIRKRLSNISWFMGKLKERISRRANAEDGVSGHFWQARFKCTRLDSPEACLACSVYIDLNLVRAGIATMPENSFYTSIYRRIIAVQSRRKKQQRKKEQQSESELPFDIHADAFLAPIYELEVAMFEKHAELGMRASDDSAFGIDFEQYLELVDKTGRQLVPGKKGVIPAELPPVLDRLGIARDVWTDSIKNFDSWTRRVVGTPTAMAEAAKKAGRQWYQGIGRCRALFPESPPPDK